MSESRSTTTRRNLIKGIGVGLASGGLLALGTDKYVDWLEVVRTQITLPRWTANGFRIGVLSDLHLNSDSQRRRGRKSCDLIVNEKPDLIVVTGDFINFTRQNIATEFANVFEPLEAAGCPVIGILGNHDYWSLFPERVVDALSKTPVKLLRNEMFDYQGIQVAGLDDAIVGRARFDFYGPSEASSNLISLLHEPDFVVHQSLNVSLQISGHSHGGQICLPGGIPIKPPPYGERYIAGFYPDAKVPLYVTRGVGTTGPDVRAFCRPEVSVLTLSS